MSSQTIQHLAAVVSVSMLVMLTNLGGPRLWDRDEPRNAGCAREMLERGNWIVPTFNAELRTHKPVLQYWSIMLSYSVLGVSEFSARLPSAVYAILTAVLTWLIGRRLFSPTAGLWAGVAIGSSLLFVMAGRACTPDATLIFWSTLSIAIYVLRMIPEPVVHANLGGASTTSISGADRVDAIRHPLFPDFLTAILMYGAMGFAVLAKGPIGIVIPTAVIGLFLLIETLPTLSLDHMPVAKRWPLQLWHVVHPVHFLKTCWQMRPITAIVVAMAIALPWYVAVGIATDGEFLQGFLLDHNLSRATQAMEGHRGNIFFYPAAILVGMFPWSVLAIPLVIEVTRRIQRRDAQSRSLVLAISWVAVYIGIFSIAKTKLPSYITPCYPAAALLVGYVVDRWVRGELLISKYWAVVASCVMIVVGTILAAAVPVITAEHLPGEEWLGVLGLLPIATAVGAILIALQQHRMVAAGWFAGGSAAVVMSIFALGAQRADEHQQSHEMLAAIFSEHEAPRLASYRTLEPSWVFYAGTPITEFLPRNRTPQSRELMIDQSLKHLESGSDAFLITNSAGIVELDKRLPAGVEVIVERPLFLKGDQLFVLGRRNADASPGKAATARINRLLAKDPPATLLWR